jgi:hypothetical protein
MKNHIHVKILEGGGKGGEWENEPEVVNGCFTAAQPKKAADMDATCK